MSDPKPRRKLAAILAADVVGFSKMMGENEDRTLKNLKACRSLTDESIISNHGRIFGSAGDSIIAEFASPVDAVIAATEFQRNLRLRNEGVSEENKMMFRVGLNLGDVIVEEDNLYGDGVNVASRLEALAEPGGITLSGKFHDEVSRKLDMSFVSTGDQEMKNIQNPIPTFKIELTEIENTGSGSDPEIKDSITKSVSENKTDSDSKPPAIAVLPFANMSGDSEQEFFVDGITEDIITNLSLWRNFPVISRSSSFTYKGKNQNLKHVSKELGARYIVEGSVRKGGNKIRITAQLIDAYEDHHLWSKKWDRNIDDVFEVQDEVSRSIAAQINPTLGNYERERIERSKPNNYSAWEYYMRSLKVFYEKSTKDREDKNLNEAREFCEKAIEKDPLFSLAYSMLAKINHSELIRFAKEDSDAILDEMFQNASKAAELDPQNPESSVMLSTYYFFKGDFTFSQNHAEKAVELNPSNPEAYMRLGLSMIHQGDYENSEEFVRKSIEIDPLDPKIVRRKIPYFFLYMGRNEFQKAFEVTKEILEHSPNAGLVKGFKASVMGFLDYGNEAKQALDEYLELRPNLKTREDFKKIFVPNSTLADTLIDGLIKAGWQPE